MHRTQLFQPSFGNQTLRCGITCAATANYRPRLRQNGTSTSQKSPSRCRFDAFFAAGRVFPVVFRRYPIAMPSRVSSTVPSGSGGQSSGLRVMVSAGSADTKKSRGHYPTGFFREDLAGVVGFEPTSGGFRIRCLNRTWRYPSPDMVRSERLELSWLSPQPPQGCASTNFATTASGTSNFNLRRRCRDLPHLRRCAF